VCPCFPFRALLLSLSFSLYLFIPVSRSLVRSCTFTPSHRPLRARPSDARRDLDELGASFIKIRDVSEFTYNKIDGLSSKTGKPLADSFHEGVLFSTYASLIAEARDKDEQGKKKTRFDQMTRWFGRGFGIDSSGRPEGNRKEYGGMVRLSCDLLKIKIKCP
jgi:hypothetical protein